MKKLTRLIFFLQVSFSLFSCTAQDLYEIRSPCVLDDTTDHPYLISPCPKRPVNLNYSVV